MNRSLNKSEKRLAFSVMFAVFSIMVCALVFVGATYAWFTNHVNTNITPMHGSVGTGDAQLSIASSRDGEYGINAPVNLLGRCEALTPLSTADLENFYYATARTTDGMSYLYQQRSAAIYEDLIYGEIYVKSDYADADLYFSRTKLRFEGDSQLLASLRLGIIITSFGEESTYIFSLDDITDTSGAQTQETTLGASNSVIAGVDDKGKPNYISDPALDLSDFMAADGENATVEAESGERALCRLVQGESARIRIFIYMEGCDENTLNSAQHKEFDFDLAFCGVKP